MDSTSIKALKAIEWLCQRETPTGVTEMAIALGLGKSNAHRVLTTLEAMGYVAAQEDGRYAPTLKMWELGCSVVDRLDFKHLARPLMESLCADSEETVHLSILDGTDVVYIDKVESSQPVRAYSRIGGRAPAHAVATGKALLAFQRDLEKLLPKKLKVYTAHTTASRDELARELASIRNGGYAINRGEWRDGVCGVAAAVRNNHGEVICAVGISGPANRLTVARLNALGPRVIESARKLSHQLGYRPALLARGAEATSEGGTAAPAGRVRMRGGA
jgi:DNA-binding IclR family transcriptional regulator